MLSMLCTVLLSLTAGVDDVRLTLSGPERDLPAVPVSFAVGRRVDPDTEELLDGEGRPVPFQTEGEGKATRLWWIARDVRAGQPRHWRLVPRRSGPRPALPEKTVQLVPRESRLEVQLAGVPFTAFHFPKDAPRPYLFPVEAFDRRITRSWPMDESVEAEKQDHPHHQSIWFSYGDVDGIDFWANPAPNRKTGRIVHRSFSEQREGPVFAQLTSLQDWVGPDEQVLLKGREDLRFYQTPENPIIDVTMTLTAARPKVRIGDTKEGMMGIRVHPGLKQETGGSLTNSEALIGEKSLWGKPARWCDMSGTIDGMAAGIALLDHPSSTRYPTRWHARGYGLLAANPFGLRYFLRDAEQDGGLTLAEGESITFRYRIVIHRGDAAEGAVEQHWRVWAKESIRAD